MKIDEQKKRWRKLVHNQELCVNPNSTCSQLRGICQSKHHLFISKRYVEKIWSHTFFTPFQLTFYLNLVFQTSLCVGSFLLLEESNCILSPSPPELPSSIFSTTTTCLQLLNIYFTMAKRKFIAMVTPNTLETMIE